MGRFSPTSAEGFETVMFSWLYSRRCKGEPKGAPGFKLGAEINGFLLYSQIDSVQAQMIKGDFS